MSQRSLLPCAQHRSLGDGHHIPLKQIQVSQRHKPRQLLKASQRKASRRHGGSAQGSRRDSSVSKASENVSYPTSSGYGGGSGDGVNSEKSQGGGGDGGDGGEGGRGLDLTPLLVAAGKSKDALPEDMLLALKEGRLPKDILERYLKIDDSFLAPFLNIGGFRERLLADPSFFVKLGIEIGIGMAAKSTAEWNKRGDNFSKELDFVLANVLMALLADFCLVWLPAPTYSLREKKAGTSFLSNNPIQRYFSNCPDNAFQKIPSGYKPFTFAQRCGAPIRNGLKLLVVGFGASLFGVGATNALISVRQLLDSGFNPQNPPQNIFTMSAAYASYMAISSNLRYQIIAGVIEERGIEVFLKGNPKLCNVLSFVVRTANTYLGSLLWVDYIRLLGLQKAPGH